MGFRLRKSVSLGGVKLSAGKKGIGVSAGIKGLRVSHGADGKTRVTASIPGTGISYQETISGNKKQETKRKKESKILKQYDDSTLLYSFQGVIKAISEDGKLVMDEFNRHFYNGDFNVSFYRNYFHMIDPERGQQTWNSFVGDITIKKNSYETGIWIFKGIRTDIIIEVNDVEYTFKVQTEAVADQVVAWHIEFMENWNGNGSVVNDDWIMEEEELNTEKEEDDCDVYMEDEPPVMSCTHCYTRDILEDWQMSLNEETNDLNVYCKHCGFEYDVQESFDWESKFLNPEGNYAFNSIACANCDDNISLIGVPFENEVAYVTCSSCKKEIRITPPS